MTDRLETPRLVLRKARDEDLEGIFINVWRDERLAETMLWTPTATLEDARARLARTKDYQKRYDAFFVCLKETNEPVGFAGVREIAPGEYDETGICVCRKEQHKGLGGEVLDALIGLTFEKRGGHTFYYSCFRGNAASAALCKSRGFVYLDSYEQTRERDGRTFLCDRYVLKK